MTTQNIADYLTKQLFISRNIVTYRSLSREFGIHVNVAKNVFVYCGSDDLMDYESESPLSELAAFHATATNSSDQMCYATYIVSGRVHGSGSEKLKESQSSSDMDVDMGYGFTPTPTPNYGFASGSDQYGGDAVVQFRMTVVGEDNLKDTKAKYEKVTSVHVYSLSPSPIRDADLLCAPTQQIRETDNQKGIEMAKAVGRIIGADIKMVEGNAKAKTRAAVTTSVQPPIPKLKAGPSITTTTVMKNEDKAKEPVKEEPKKPKPTGKLNFFAPKVQASPKEKEKEKEKDKEASSSKDSAETKGRKFFGATSKSSAPTGKAKETTSTSTLAPPKESEKAEQTKRGTKRKPTTAGVSDDEDEETNSAAPSGPSSRFSSQPPSARSSPQPTKFSSKSRPNRAVLSSDDEVDNEPPMKKTRRRLRHKAILGSDDESGHDSKATSEAREFLKSMMELDDDKVEKVTRKVRVGAPEKKIETDLERDASEIMKKGEDVDMSADEDLKPKPKPRKKKEKKVIPVGRNGLKKRPVTKTRTIKKDDGWSVSDYTSYESVSEGEEQMSEPAPPKKGKRGPAKSVKEKKEVAEKIEPRSAAADATASGGECESKPTIKASTSKPAGGAKGGRKQKTLNTFFGPPKMKK